MKTVKPAFTAEDNYGEMSADEMVDRMFEFAAADGRVCIPVWSDETDAPCKEDEYRSIKLKWTLGEKEAFKSEFEDMTSKLFAAMDMLHSYAGNDVADALQRGDGRLDGCRPALRRSGRQAFHPAAFPRDDPSAAWRGLWTDNGRADRGTGDRAGP